MNRDDFERNEKRRSPLATSADDTREGHSYSREANNSPRASRQEEGYHSGSNGLAGTRRRRRISEMAPERTTRGYSPRPEYDRPEYPARSYEEDERRSQSNYYREQYHQQREERRQSYQQEPRSYDQRPKRNNYDPSKRPQRNYNGPNTGDRPQQPYGRQQGNKPHQRRTNNRPVYNEPPIDPTTEIRLNKFLANAGICSRRESDELIKAGAVLVNGIPVTELGSKITGSDRVEVNGKEVRPENKVYVLLNKPRNCVTTTDDPQERLTVMHLVRSAAKERIYPVGRLDRNTTGVLLLTNDGDLAAKLVHPSYKKKKIYHVWLDKEVAVEDMQAIANGIELEDGEMHADAISYVDEEDLTQVGIEIHSGRNRIVRRIFEHLGYHVKKLDRVYFAGLTKKNLGRGKWRYLTQEEVSRLKMGAFD